MYCLQQGLQQDQCVPCNTLVKSIASFCISVVDYSLLAEPQTPPPTVRPIGPFQPQWPTPANNPDQTTTNRITLNLPGLPQLPQGSVFDVQYRRPGGNWNPAGSVPVRTTPQTFDVPFLQPDTPYTFRFRYRSSTVPQGSPYSPVEQFRTSPSKKPALTTMQ